MAVKGKKQNTKLFRIYQEHNIYQCKKNTLLLQMKPYRLFIETEKSKHFGIFSLLLSLSLPEMVMGKIDGCWIDG